VTEEANMLPPWIIEKIREDERRKRRESPQPQIHTEDVPPSVPSNKDDDDSVVVIVPGEELSEASQTRHIW
jgi:hypothetical protein